MSPSIYNEMENCEQFQPFLMNNKSQQKLIFETNEHTDSLISLFEMNKNKKMKMKNNNKIPTAEILANPPANNIKNHPRKKNNKNNNNNILNWILFRSYTLIEIILLNLFENVTQVKTWFTASLSTKCTKVTLTMEQTIFEFREPFILKGNLLR
jgi:hypothetical protein